MEALAAARLGDEIAHGFGLAAIIAGAVAGAVIGAAVVAATAATGGLAAVIIAGSIAAGGLSMFQIVKGINTIFNLPEPATGKLIRGSPDVFFNNKNAMRAGEDVASSCSGFPCNHIYWPFPDTISEGSATVYANNKPAARVKSKMVCGAHIKSGSPDITIGGKTERVGFVLDLESWALGGLQVLGIAALFGAGGFALAGGLASIAGFVVIGGGMYKGMELLGDLGDRIGPGYKDVLQGAAGMAMLGLSPKMAKYKGPNKLSRAEIDELVNGIGGSIKNNPLRQEYERAVVGLKDLEINLRNQNLNEENIARSLHQARRDLGVKYKDLTPKELKEYIYEVNEERYGDKLGPTFEYLRDVKKKSYQEIIESSQTPNSNVDKLLGGFKGWLLKKNGY